MDLKGFFIRVFFVSLGLVLGNFLKDGDIQLPYVIDIFLMVVVIGIIIEIFIYLIKRSAR